MKLAWFSHTRPDCLFEISQLAQITEQKFVDDKRYCVKRLNKSIRYATFNKVSLQFPKLDVAMLRLITFSDASLSNNDDYTSQLEHICFIGDASGRVFPLSFKSYKARRVTRSVMTGEVIAFSDLFDVAATSAHELETILGQHVPVKLFTDSKCLFDVISNGSRISEKTMMIDIAAAREGFCDKVISDIWFVRSSRNLADGLTKSMSQAALRDVLDTGHLEVKPEQWIVCN